MTDDSRDNQECAESRCALGASHREKNGHLSPWIRSAGTSTSVTPRKENRSFTRYFGGCSNSAGDRSLEHYTLGLEASEVDAHDLARLEHRSCTKILPPREVKCICDGLALGTRLPASYHVYAFSLPLAA
jgi:hypothetical protein